jgi:hypothetical protein
MSHFRGRNVNHGAMPTAVSTGTRSSQPSYVMPHRICIDERHCPHTVQNQVPRHSESGPIDSPGEFFHKYLAKEAEKVKKGECQREDANEVLIFVCFHHFPPPYTSMLM